MKSTINVVVLLALVGVTTFYYGYKFGDRAPPYDRIFGIITPVNPSECGLPSGPIPEVISASGGDCVRQEWTIDRHKVCNVDPSDPVVRRWLIDEIGSDYKLPVIKSEQVNGQVPRMSKTFIQPKVTPGWVSYRARVCLVCPTDAFLMEGMLNPLQRLFPVCVDRLSTEYRVK